MKKLLFIFLVFSTSGSFAQTTPQPTSQQPQQQDCPTGDFCFINPSHQKKVIDILGPQDYGGYYKVLFTITIMAGQTGCFYDIPAVVQNINITTFDAEEGGTSPMNFTPARTHQERRQIRVKPCAKEENIKPLKL